MSRARVLSLYRRILAVSRTWTAVEPANTAAERAYIRAEAGWLFRQNKTLTDSKEIELRIQEGEARLAIGTHYLNPYPRPVYTPLDTFAGTDAKKKRKFKQKIQSEGRPIYVHSYKDD